MGGLTVTQLDPAVLAELPQDVVEELVAGLPPSHEPFAKEGNLSPDASSSGDEGGGADEAAAAPSPQWSNAEGAQRNPALESSPAHMRALGSPGAAGRRGPARSGVRSTLQQPKVRHRVPGHGEISIILAIACQALLPGCKF